jgi:TPR repeat protein
MALKRIIRFLSPSWQVGLLLVSWALPGLADTATAERAYQNGDYPTAFREFLRLAEQGSAYAQFHVAYMYDLGQGVANNGEEAVRWYRAAAAQGAVAAQINLGLMLEEGDRVAKDYEEAAKWYRLAANQGNPRAQCKLGLLYGAGNGVPRDYAESVKWLRASAQLGYLAAQKGTGPLARPLVSTAERTEMDYRLQESEADLRFEGGGEMVPTGGRTGRRRVTAGYWWDVPGRPRRAPERH